MNNDLIIKNVRPLGKELSDILIQNGRIVSIATGLKAEDGIDFEDGGGAIALPGLVGAHTHLDKSLLGMGWKPHQAGPSLKDKIDNECQLKKEWNIDPERQSARQVLQSLKHGSTIIRSHVDIDDTIKLDGFEGVAKTRDKYREEMDIEIVVFPQSGLMICPGTVDMMDEALSNGADVIGGLDPCGIDRDPKGQLDAIFKLAEKHGKPIDIHLHEPDELGAFSMDMIIERTRAHGMQGQVAISHAFCLGMADRSRALGLVERLAQQNIAIVTVATPSRPVPSAAELRDAGVILCAGSDGIRDTWAPYGNGDMLERAMLLGLRNNFRYDSEIEYALWCCTFGGAKMMGIKNYGITEGSAGDVVLVAAETVAQAVVDRPSRQLVVKRGRGVARNGNVLI